MFAYTTAAKDIFWSVPGKFEMLAEAENADKVEIADSIIPKSQSWSEWISVKFFGRVEKELSVTKEAASCPSEQYWQTVADFRGVEFSLQVREY